LFLADWRVGAFATDPWPRGSEDHPDTRARPDCAPLSIRQVQYRFSSRAHPRFVSPTHPTRGNIPLIFRKQTEEWSSAVRSTAPDHLISFPSVRSQFRRELKTLVGADATTLTFSSHNHHFLVPSCTPKSSPTCLPTSPCCSCSYSSLSLLFLSSPPISS